MRLVQTIVVLVLCAACGLAAQSKPAFAGKWQGETGTGRRVTLDLTVKGSQATGMFTLVQQTVEVMEGKVDDKTLSFKVALEGRTLTLRQVYQAIAGRHGLLLIVETRLRDASLHLYL